MLNEMLAITEAAGSRHQFSWVTDDCRGYQNPSSPKTLRLQCYAKKHSQRVVSACPGPFKGAAIFHKDRHILITCLDSNSEKC